jgi:poly-gamma-glutamate capsule biosynthesis protein CapA/YwtB (metallophosphatase superfamily)
MGLNIKVVESMSSEIVQVNTIYKTSDLLRYMIDLGADFIYSSHSHIIQPHEIYKKKYIFYGLGNFYFASQPW